MIATAKLKYLGVSAQKTRLVADQLRGAPVEDALAILRNSRRAVSRDIEKLLRSALANAEQKNPDVDVDELIVSRILVDDGPPMKRARHRAMGRVFRILKRSCHVTVGLDVPAGRGDAQ